MSKFFYTVFLVCFVLSFVTGCKDNENPDGFKKGKNRYTLISESTEREYYVHVPEGYTGGSPAPVVFMLHGTAGTGLDMWERSGWKEVGEDENILTVFPSSLRYCIHDTDGTKTIAKWNSQPVEWQFCNPSEAKDDILFLNLVLDEVIEKFNVDEKRVYLVGFSNGGQMAAKTSIFLSDRLAAVISNAASFYPDTMFTPLRKLPTMFQLGNADYGPGNTGPEIPLSTIDIALSSTEYKPGRVASTHIKSFGLSTQYTLTGDTNTAMIATYPSLTPGSPNDYRFVFVKGLAHAYPNGDQHWMEAAELHWNWLKQYEIN